MQDRIEPARCRGCGGRRRAQRGEQIVELGAVIENGPPRSEVAVQRVGVGRLRGDGRALGVDAVDDRAVGEKGGRRCLRLDGEPVDDRLGGNQCLAGNALVVE